MIDYGVTRAHAQDELLIIERVQDVEPALEHVKRLQSHGINGSKEMRHRAHFPAVIVEAYCNRAGITFAEFMRDPAHARRMVNDRDLSGFRVS